MNKTEFIYNSFSPSPYCVPQKNKVTVWVENGEIHYKRNYICSDGKVSDTDICQTVKKVDTTVEKIAELIHWGCSGTSRNSYQLKSIIENIKPVVESLK